MPKTVDIPNVGTVDFPDNMSEGAMSLAVKKIVQDREPTQFHELGSELWKDAKGVAKTGLTLAKASVGNVDDQDVVNTVKGIGQGIADRTTEESAKAREAGKKGDYLGEVGHSIASVPVVGGLLSDLGTDAMNAVHGKWGKPAAHMIEMLAPKASERFLPASVTAQPLVRNVNNAVEERALQKLEGKVRMTAGQRFGNKGLQRVEAGMTNLAGSSGRAHDFYAGAQEDIATTGRNEAANAGEKKLGRVGAGERVQDRLQDRFVKLKTQADRLYDKVRAATATNKVTVQTGTKPTGLVGPSGQALTTPVTQVFDSPVALAPMRTQLETIHKELMANLPEVRRANSPAFQALDNFMKSDADHMSAMEFDKFLGALKSISRDGKSEFLTSQSQALARKMINEGEAGLDTALKGAGPNAATQLKSARNVVKSYYETGELRARYKGDPASVYKRLAQGDDIRFKELTRLQKLAPHEVKQIGRTYLEGMINKATREGGFGRSAGILADWDRLGPQTKELLYGKQITEDIDDFLIGAKRLTRPVNASESGHMVYALTALGAIGPALAGGIHAMITGDASHLLTAAQATGSAVAVPNILSRVMFSPGGAKALTKAITIPVKSPAYNAASTALKVRVLNAIAAEKREREKENQPPQ